MSRVQEQVAGLLSKTNDLETKWKTARHNLIEKDKRVIDLEHQLAEAHRRCLGIASHNLCLDCLDLYYDFGNKFFCVEQRFSGVQGESAVCCPSVNVTLRAELCLCCARVAHMEKCEMEHLFCTEGLSVAPACLNSSGAC
jgi:hypothetical protein